MPDKFPESRPELLDEIDTNWSAINDALDELAPEQMLSPTDAQGWAVKDHLNHMGAWNNWALYLLQGKPPWDGMGITESQYKIADNDARNGIIQALHAGKSPAEARAFLQASHDSLMALVLPLSDDDLQRPFRPLRRDEPPDRVIPPVSHVVYETTADHYADHLGWFQALAAGEG